MFTEITIAIQQQVFVAEKEISTEMSGGWCSAAITKQMLRIIKKIIENKTEITVTLYKVMGLPPPKNILCGPEPLISNT